jgi:hypothetical protein
MIETYLRYLAKTPVAATEYSARVLPVFTQRATLGTGSLE